MKCPYNCRLRINDDLCNLRAELCKTYGIHKRNAEQVKELEARFGEIRQDIKKIYTENGGI